jgi:uncharacterized protein DUF3572
MEKRPNSPARKAAETLAIQALSFIAADPDRLGGFLAATGIGPDDIRAAARQPLFLAGVLDHITADEKLLLAFAGESKTDPRTVERAQQALSGRPHERDVP